MFQRKARSKTGTAPAGGGDVLTHSLHGQKRIICGLIVASDVTCKVYTVKLRVAAVPISAPMAFEHVVSKNPSPWATEAGRPGHRAA